MQKRMRPPKGIVMKRRLHNKLNTNARSGFTLVELIVTLAVAAIVASIGGMSLINWHNHSEYLKNTETAKTIYLAAQSALSEAESKGVLEQTMIDLEKDTSYVKVSDAVEKAALGFPTEADAEGIQHEYAYFSVSRNLGIADRQMRPLYQFLDSYLQGEDVLDVGSYSVEFDLTACKVYAVFYGEWIQEFPHEAAVSEDSHGTYAVNKDSREESHLSGSFAGYYSAGQANYSTPAASSGSLPKMKSAALVNDEVLALQFSSTSETNADTNYLIQLKDQAGNLKYILCFDWTKLTKGSLNTTDGYISCALTVYDMSASGIKSSDYQFPVSYDGSLFSIVLDGMMSAQSMAINTAAGSSQLNTSVTRLFGNTPQKIYATVDVFPQGSSFDDLVDYSTKAVKASTPISTDQQNDLFATKEDTAKPDASFISVNRHFSNIRFLSGDTEKQAVLLNNLSWNNNVVFGINASGTISQLDASTDEFPSVAVLAKTVTLDGAGFSYIGLKVGPTSNYVYSGSNYTKNLADSIGLFAKNNGSIQNLNIIQASFSSNSAFRYVGGFAGQNLGAISSCSFSGAIVNSYSENASDCYGGICGANGDRTSAEVQPVISDCSVKNFNMTLKGWCTITDTDTSDVKLTKSSMAGGIAGYNRSGARISSCCLDSEGDSTVNITANNGMVGGIAGGNEGNISGCGYSASMKVLEALNQYMTVYGNTYAARNLLDYIFQDETDEANQQLSSYVQEHYTALLLEEINAGKAEDEKISSDTLKKEISDYKTAAQTLKTKIDSNDTRVTLELKNSLAVSSIGYLGGIIGFNGGTAAVSSCASGHWLIHGYNLSQASCIGGIIGQNTSGNVSEDGGVSFCVNAAYVHRFYCYDKTKDEGTVHANNKGLNGTERCYAGGIIGEQRSSVTGSLIQKCMNLGDVYDENSSNAGGVVGRWNINGGSISDCSNFSSLYTNYGIYDMTKSNGSGSGGIIADIYGDSADPNANYSIDHCSNHGNILSIHQNDGFISECAQFAGGIIGTVIGDSNLKNYDTNVSITDCLNGSDAQINSYTVGSGILGWVEWTDGVNAGKKVNIMIDHCRNYSSVFVTAIRDRYAVPKPKPNYQDIFSKASGIFGTTSNYDTSLSIRLTISNCFSIFNGTPGAAINYPITENFDKTFKLNSANEFTSDCTNNYYMDAKSFASQTGELNYDKRGDSGTVSAFDAASNAESADANTVRSVRLYAGNALTGDNSPADYFGAYSSAFNLINISGKAWIAEAANAIVQNTRSAKGNDVQVGDIDLWYEDRTLDNQTSSPVPLDVSDESVMKYLDHYLDAKISGPDAGYSYNAKVTNREIQTDYRIDLMVFEVSRNADDTSPFIYTEGMENTGVSSGNISRIFTKTLNGNMNNFTITDATGNAELDWNTYYYYMVLKVYNADENGTALADGRTAYSVPVKGEVLPFVKEDGTYYNSSGKTGSNIVLHFGFSSSGLYGGKYHIKLIAKTPLKNKDPETITLFEGDTNNNYIEVNPFAEKSINYNGDLYEKYKFFELDVSLVDGDGNTTASFSKEYDIVKQNDIPQLTG